jgi:hypothetical protein
MTSSTAPATKAASDSPTPESMTRRWSARPPAVPARPCGTGNEERVPDPAFEFAAGHCGGRGQRHEGEEPVAGDLECDEDRSGVRHRQQRETLDLACADTEAHDVQLHDVVHRDDGGVDGGEGPGELVGHLPATGGKVMDTGHQDHHDGSQQQHRDECDDLGRGGRGLVGIDAAQGAAGNRRVSATKQTVSAAAKIAATEPSRTASVDDRRTDSTPDGWVSCAATSAPRWSSCCRVVWAARG